MSRINKTPSIYGGGDGRITASGIYIGIVRRNDDPQNMGRLSVWIPEMGGSLDNENNWFIVSYASPFAGVTDTKNLREDAEDMSGSAQSYGFWMIPPDLGNQVLVAFVNGNVAKGYWFACLYQQNMNHMVPGIPSNVPTDPALQNGIEGGLPPVVEYNKRSKVNPDDPPRPVFEPLHNGLKAEGLYSDQERGPSSSGARREAPSKVFGWLTPRGNSVHVDDNEENEFIRFRTRGGTQILVHETTGYIYMNSKDGNSWVEISDEGVDIYSKHSVSVHGEEDINLRAGKNINLDAGGAITARAGSTVGIQAGSDMNVRASGKIAQSAGGNITEKAGGNHIRTASQILDNSGSSAPTVPEQEAGTRSGVETTVSRMPTHEPWEYHPKEGMKSSDDNTPGVWSGQQGQNGGEKKSARDLRTVRTGSGKGKIVDKTFNDTSPVVTKIGQCKATQNVVNAIKEGASVSGMPFGYMMAKASQESCFNPNVKASTSSATGLYQFTDSTWKGMVDKYGGKYGIGINDRMNPRANAIMGGLFAKDNAAYLKSKGLPTGNTDLYIAHFLGAGGAATFLSAKQKNPNAPAYTAVSPASAKANKSIFYDRSGTPRTTSEVYALFQAKIEPNARAYAQAYGTNG